jgi:hypothetical protein
MYTKIENFAIIVMGLGLLYQFRRARISHVYLAVSSVFAIAHNIAPASQFTQACQHVIMFPFNISETGYHLVQKTVSEISGSVSNDSWENLQNHRQYFTELFLQINSVIQEYSSVIYTNISELVMEISNTCLVWIFTLTAGFLELMKWIIAVTDGYTDYLLRVVQYK